MTDTEIIKALECCRQPVGSGACNNCPFDYQRKKRLEETDKSCTELMFDCALDLINRQQKQIDELVERHLNHEEAVKKAKEACYKCQERHKEEIKTAKTEAVKEFAERLKALLPNDGMSPEGRFKFGRIKSLDIDNLLKEMGCE